MLNTENSATPPANQGTGVTREKLTEASRNRSLKSRESALVEKDNIYLRNALLNMQFVTAENKRCITVLCAMLRQ